MAWFQFDSREYALNDDLVVTLSDISKTISAQGGIFVYDLDPVIKKGNG